MVNRLGIKKKCGAKQRRFLCALSPYKPDKSSRGAQGFIPGTLLLYILLF
jgi:hypothetical protein